MISDRYNFFGKDNLLSVSYTDVIIDFNAALIGSNLSADYILYEKKNNSYNHLCIAKNSYGERYVESYFNDTKDTYIKGQKIVKISKVEIYDASEELILSDKLH